MLKLKKREVKVSKKEIKSRNKKKINFTVSECRLKATISKSLLE